MDDGTGGYVFSGRATATAHVNYVPFPELEVVHILGCVWKFMYIHDGDVYCNQQHARKPLVAIERNGSSWTQPFEDCVVHLHRPTHTHTRTHLLLA